MSHHKKPVRHPFRCCALAVACALLLTGCDRKPEPLEYTGEMLRWENSGSLAMLCDTFRPQQYPILCVQTPRVLGRTEESAPPPDPEVPRGVFHPRFGSHVEKGVELPRARLQVSAFEREEPSAGGERYFGPNVKFTGTVRIAGHPVDDGALVTIHRSHIFLNSRKVASLDDFELDVSQKKGGEQSLYVTPLFHEMTEFVRRKKREHESLGKEYEPAAVGIFADADAPLRRIQEVLHTLSQLGARDFHFILESHRQTERVHCAHFVDDRPEPPVSVRWWRCYEKPGEGRVVTELEFVDIGAVGPVGYNESPNVDLNEPDGAGENVVVVGPHGFHVLLGGTPVDAAEGCDHPDVTICNRDGELDYAALHALLRERGEAAGADAFLVRPANAEVAYEQMLTTTQLLSRPSPTTTFSDSGELFSASSSDGELTPLASRVAWAASPPKHKSLGPGPPKNLFNADGTPKYRSQ